MATSEHTEGGTLGASGPPGREAPADPGPRLAPSPQNFACRWTPGPNGAGALVVIYAGPLATRDDACLRFGLGREGGGPWSDTREVRLQRDRGHTSVATLDVPAGAPVIAVQFAVRSGDAWDNGGRAPLGYYEWRAGEIVAVG